MGSLRRIEAAPRRKVKAQRQFCDYGNLRASGPQAQAYRPKRRLRTMRNLRGLKRAP
jgi:hypothetical protein